MAPHGTLAIRPSGPPSPLRRRRKRRSRRGGQSGLRWLAVSLVVVAAFAAIAVSRPAQDRTIAPATVGGVPAIPVAARARPIYRYSVIRGGVYSSAELIAAAASDPVVSAQYGSVSRTPVRTSAVVRPRRAYMSYRIGDEIYWTKGKLLLSAGEMTLTNGDVEIRSRCGNQISEKAMTPTSDAEPDAVEFDRLIADEPGSLASDTLPGGVDAASAAVRGAAPEATPSTSSAATLAAPSAAASVTDAPALSAEPMAIPDGASPFFMGSAAGKTSRERGPSESTSAAPPPGLVVPPGGDVPPVRDVPPGGEVPPGGDGPPADLVLPSDFEVATVAHVPEPGTIVLLGTALSGLAAVLLRKRRIARRQAHRSPPA